MNSKLAYAAVAVAAILHAPVVSAQTTPRQYRGNDKSYYQNCKKSSGTTGAVAGAGGGGIGAAALGAGPVGVVAAAAGGGLLGRHLDKKHDAAQNRKNGC